MKFDMTFVEKTVKTITVEVNNRDELVDIMHECMDNISDRIDFEKNPDSYEIYCDEIKEVEE